MDIKRRILAADNPEGIAALQNILGDSVDITTATSFLQSVKALDEPLDMIVCGVHFDESRMFDLLIHARTDPRTHNMPFIVFRDQPSELNPTFFKSLEISVSSFGAAFVDLFTLKTSYDVADADKQFRKLIFELIERR
jgi:CheY-like chemotaxis protein